MKPEQIIEAGRSGGDRPQAGGIAQRGFVGFKGRPDCGSANER